MGTTLIVSLAWGRRYLPLLERLRRSARDQGVDSDLYPREGEPPHPGAAKRLKPKVILKALELNDPVIWVDADGVLKSPIPEFETDDDLAMVKNRGLWEPNVIFCHGSQKAQDALRLWQERMPEDFHGSDAAELNAAILDVNPRVAELPVELAWVEDWYYNRYGRRDPVIELNRPLERCCG